MTDTECSKMLRIKTRTAAESSVLSDLRRAAAVAATMGGVTKPDAPSRGLPFSVLSFSLSLPLSLSLSLSLFLSLSVLVNDLRPPIVVAASAAAAAAAAAAALVIVTDVAAAAFAAFVAAIAAASFSAEARRVEMVPVVVVTAAVVGWIAAVAEGALPTPIFILGCAVDLDTSGLDTTDSVSCSSTNNCCRAGQFDVSEVAATLAALLPLTEDGVTETAVVVLGG